MTDLTDPTIAYTDVETTALHRRRRAWEGAVILRPPGQADTEHHWFVDVRDLDLSYADPVSLRIGGFWDRHPQARWVREESDGNVRLTPDAHYQLPDEGVVRELDLLTAVAELTAGKAVIAGSNPDFDRETLGPRMEWHGITPGWHYHPLDVPGEARGWLRGRGGTAPWKSDDIARACDVDPDRYERHTALGDCRMMRDLYDRTDGRWVPGPPPTCATGFCHDRPTTLVGGEPRCAPCAKAIDPDEADRQPLPDRTVIR